MWDLGPSGDSDRDLRVGGEHRMAGGASEAF